MICSMLTRARPMDVLPNYSLLIIKPRVWSIGVRWTLLVLCPELCRTLLTVYVFLS